MSRCVVILACALCLAACGPRVLEPDAPYDCERCADWNKPQDPFRVYGNTWYVGTEGLSSILIETSNGLILVDGGLAQSAPLIDANIRELGFDPLDIKAIFVSHAHSARDDLNLAIRSTSRILIKAVSLPRETSSSSPMVMPLPSATSR